MYPLVIACFFLSGATGLVYEVLWGKYLALFIGVTGYAHTVVLATFMGGLALGNALLGRLADRARSPLAMYALIEVAIGLYAALFPTLFDWLSWAYLRLASPEPGAALNLLLKVVLAALCLLPPTVLMGGTLPALSRFVVRSLANVGPRVGLLYGLNSAGAALGCLLAGFFFIKSFGLDASMMIAACLNVAIGLVLLGLRRRVAEVALVSNDEPATPAGRPAADRSAQLMAWLIFVSGMVSMLLELVWIRLLSLILGSSAYSFSLMLFTFISGIAVGGLLAGLVLRHCARRPVHLFGLAQLGLFLCLLVTMPLYDRIPYLFAVLDSMLSRTHAAYTLYHVIQTAVCVLLMAVPAVLMGMTLPFAGAEAVGELRLLGAAIGSMFSANTVGNVLGTILAGFVVIPALGLQSGLLAGVVVSGLVGGTAICTSAKRLLWRRYAFIIPGVLLAAGAAALAPPWNWSLLHRGVFRLRAAHDKTYREFVARHAGDRLEYHRDGREVSVAVFRTASDTSALRLTVNGKPDASTSVDMCTQLMLAHLPLLLHPSPARVLTIGYGSGVTAGAVLQHDALEHQDVAELSSEVIEASRFFEHVNRRPLADPRTVLHLIDAREMLLLCRPATWDVIISEPSNPWVAGIGNLFTREFFDACRRALRPGGLLVQWLHLYEMDDATLGVALNTLSSAFASVSVWSPQPSDIIAIAGEAGLRLDTTALLRRLASPSVQADLNEATKVTALSPLLQMLSLQMLGEHRFRTLYPGTGRLNRDRFPYLEYAAPKAFFLGAQARLQDHDERLRHRGLGSLLVSQYLENHPLSLTELERLHDLFAWQPRGSNLRLRDALAWEICRRAAAGPREVSRHGNAGTKDTTTDGEYCFRYGQVVPMALDRAWAERARRRPDDAGVMCTYAQHLAERTLANASVYVPSDTTELATAHARCCELASAQREKCEQGRTEVYQRVGLLPAPCPMDTAAGGARTATGVR